MALVEATQAPVEQVRVSFFPIMIQQNWNSLCQNWHPFFFDLVAIQLTLSFLTEERKKPNIDTVFIFSDSQSAVGILQFDWENKSYKKTAMDIQ